jgi:hypothetical protein
VRQTQGRLLLSTMSACHQEDSTAMSPEERIRSGIRVPHKFGLCHGLPLPFSTITPANGRPQLGDSGPSALGRRFADRTLGEIRAYPISLNGPFTQSERTSSDRFPQIFSIRAYPIGSWDRRSCLSNGKKSLQPR